MALKTRGAWKAIERWWAELLDGKRVPVSGRHRGDAPDIDVENALMTDEERIEFDRKAGEQRQKGIEGQKLYLREKQIQETLMSGGLKDIEHYKYLQGELSALYYIANELSDIYKG